MATLATLYDRLLGKGGAQSEVEARWMDVRRAPDFRLRPFPNDDICLHLKQIDNSRVIRAVDPQAPGACWKTIGGVTASAVLLIGMLLPAGYRLMAGYQIEELKKQHSDLARKMAELELQEAKLLSPEHLATLAKLQDFVDPDPSRVVHLPAKPQAPAPAVTAMHRTTTVLPAVAIPVPAVESVVAETETGIQQ